MTVRFPPFIPSLHVRNGGKTRRTARDFSGLQGDVGLPWRLWRHCGMIAKRQTAPIRDRLKCRRACKALKAVGMCRHPGEQILSVPGLSNNPIRQWLHAFGDLYRGESPRVSEPSGLIAVLRTGDTQLGWRRGSGVGLRAFAGEARMRINRGLGACHEICTLSVGLWVSPRTPIPKKSHGQNHEGLALKKERPGGSDG